MFLQQLINGLTLGSVYALIALGYTMVYGVLLMINFAHSEIFMIGAFLGWQKVILTFFIAPFFGAVAGIINLMIRKEHTIPYGPFLSLGALISLFWADKIIRMLFSR